MILDCGPTHLRLKLGARTVTMTGEASPEGTEGPDFVVHLDSIGTWDPPHENDEVSLADLGKITEAVEAAFDKRGMSVEFE